jgi:hypothetical protein
VGTDRQRLIAAEQAPFHHLVKMVEQELELAAQGRIDELHEAITRTGAYMDTLPKPAPESARALALHAEAMRGRVIVEVERARDHLTASRAAVRRGRRIARKYAAPPDGRISTSA